MTHISPLYRWDATVRDYELDCQGVVNHATYVNYFEQCRNDYARSLGIDFVEYHHKGFDLVIAAVEVHYKRPLKVKDRFYVTASISGRSEKRVEFHQEIKLQENDKVIATAKISVACVDLKTKRACMPDFLLEKLPLD